MALEFVAETRLPTEYGIFKLFAFEDSATKLCHLAITSKEFPQVSGHNLNHKPVLLRIHSECLTGDALFSQRCDCGSQLKLAYQSIADNHSGVIFYLRQEGRGIGLANKMRAYRLQDNGADTVEANEHLGFDADVRDYSICKAMFDYLNIDRVELMTNNLKKVQAIEALGIKVTKRLPHQQGQNKYNSHYLKTKADKLGHKITI